MSIPINDNWSDFQSHISTLTSYDTGKLFEKYAELLLKTDPRYNKNISEVWHFDDIPNDLRKKFQLTTIDHGIDLLMLEKIIEIIQSLIVLLRR